MIRIPGWVWGVCLAVGGGLEIAPVTGAEWHLGQGYRWRTVPQSDATAPGFESVLARDGAGLAFTNRVSAAASINNQILENGAGVALGDVDGDGWCDVYLCGSEGPNTLFRNLGGWRFADITGTAGVGCAGQFSTGTALVDLDSDRDLDLLVNGLGVGTRLFRNEGQGRFVEDRDSGLERRSAATSLALADVDADGDLDLYVATYRVISARSEMPPLRIEVRRVEGRLVVTPEDRFVAFPLSNGQVEIAEKGEPDHFYLNDGTGRFSEVAWTGGAFLDENGRPIEVAPSDWGLSVLLRDLNGDGSPDLYVCNDFFRSRDQFWLNDGTGRFRAASPWAWRSMSLSSMAADAGDLDRDGHDDLLVVEMLARDHTVRQRQRANALRPEQALPFADPAYRPEIPRNTLFRSRGDGTFAEVANFAGLAASDWSWNVAILDVDLDGFEDVIMATGNAHDVLDLDAQTAMDRAAMRGPVRPLEFYPPLQQRPLAFRNGRDLTFTEVGESWGLNETGVAQGMALGDLDNDGDLDLVLNRLNQPALVLANRASAPRWTVRLRGLPPNTHGVGARIQVRSSTGLEQSQVVVAGGRYVSSDEALKVFAVPGGASDDCVIEVRWASGRRSVVGGLKGGGYVEIEERGAIKPDVVAVRNALNAPDATALFEDVNWRLSHRHVDTSPDDFRTQPLLPHRLSQLGPGVAWCDVDGDGWEDVVVAGGRGGTLGVLRQEGGGSFLAVTNVGRPVIEGGSLAGQTAVVPWISEMGRPVLLVGTAVERQAPESQGGVVLQYSAETLRGETWFELADAEAGPIAVADLEGDGDLDLFVGARYRAGRYPLSGTSVIDRCEGGRMVGGGTNRWVLGELGMVSGAVFTDLDGDALPELVVACDWGPLRVFHLHRGSMVERSIEWGLARWTGFWQGVTAGDFDGDGRMDLVASNIGLNTRHRWSQGRPWRLYAGDFDDNGTLDVVEAMAVTGDPGEDVAWRALDVFRQAIPSWQTRFPSWRGFASTSIQGLLGDALPKATVLEAATFEHRVFLNRGGQFEARPLPREAQFAPGFGVAVADFDGDGWEDLFLAQNRFDLDLDSGRADAGTGVCLLGNGQGGFRALSPTESGVSLMGQQRGVAVADYDRDGRPDVCVSQHNETTRLLRNRSGEPGLRVRLAGPPGNPWGVGAQLRVIDSNGHPGPLREVRLGSGYGSSDSPVQVLALGKGEARLRVVWPGGRTTEQTVPPGTREVTVGFQGSGIRVER